jgi:hypothetical protein
MWVMRGRSKSLTQQLLASGADASLRSTKV